MQPAVPAVQEEPPFGRIGQVPQNLVCRDIFGLKLEGSRFEFGSQLIS